MKRGTKGAWVMAGLAVLGAMMAGGGESRAALTGITIGGGFQPGTGDPPYDYIFQVYLNPDSSLVSPYGSLYSLTHPDYFTINGLTGVTLFSATSQPEDPLGMIWVSVTSHSSVTWAFYGTTSITNPANSGQELLLGTFEVQTTKDYPIGQPPVSPGTSISYSFNVANGAGNPTHGGSGTITLANLLVPEPASSTIVLLTGGTAALGGLVVRTRRRRNTEG